MADLDSLSIQISADAANAVRSINNLAKALDSLNTSLGKLDIDKLSSLSHVLNDVANAAERLSSGSSAIKDFAKAFKDFEKASAGAKKARKATEDLANSSGSFEGAGTALRAMTEPMYQMAVVGNALATVFGRLIQYVSGLNEYASVSRVFAQLGGSSQRLIEDMGIIDTTFREIPEPALLATESVDGFAAAVDKAAGESGAKNEAGIKKVSKNIEEVITPAQKAKMAVKSLEEGIRTFGSTVKSAGSHFVVFAKKTMATATGLNGFKKFAESARGSVKKLAKEITRIAKMLKLMVTRMVLRQIISGIGDGFKNLAQYSKQFDASISLLWNDFRQLGNSIAAAASPLVNVFAPAIHAIIQLVIQAVNAINQLLSAITGLTSFVRAKKLTDSYAASLDKSNKSAKALKKTVLGFDELNQLQDNKNNGGGGTSPLDMFEDAPIEKKWADWANKIKNMWKTGDFTELGASIGKWLLNALESIPWNKVKAKAYKIGKSLATLLNGIIETPKLGREIGKTIAEAINTGVLLANGFVRNFHWDSLGKFIGETFNGFFENIDWYYIKDTVVAGMRGLASAIQNFIDTFNWDNISNFVINALDTLSAGIKAFFENIDWKEKKKKFGEQLKKIIQETDWRQIGEAIGDIIQAAIDFVSETLGQLSWEDIKQALSDLIEGFFNKADKDKISSAIVGLLSSAAVLAMGKLTFNAAKAALGEVIKNKLITAFGGQAVAQAAATQMGGAVTTAAGSAEVTAAAEAAGGATGLSFIGGVVSALAGGALGAAIIEALDLKEGWADFGQLLAETFLGITPTDDQIQQVENIKEAYDGFGGTFEAIKNGGKDVLRLIGFDIPQSTYTLKDELGNIKREVDENGKAVIDFENDVGSLKSSVGNLAISVEKDLGSVSKNVHIADTKAAEAMANMSKSVNTVKFEPVKKSAQELETTLNNTQKTVTNVATSVGQDWTGAQQEISIATDTMSLDVTEGMTGIQTSVTQSTDEIMKSFDTIKDGMTKEKWTFDGVAEGLKETFRRAKEGIKSEWNQIANTLNGNHQVGTSSVNIDLPKFANGGFPENGLFMANSTEMVGKFSNGKNAVANNDQITNGIAQAVFSAMTSAQSSSGGQYINNTIMVDGMVLARAVTKGQNDMNRRYSPTMA